jgi:hypothetical protein
MAQDTGAGDAKEEGTWEGVMEINELRRWIIRTLAVASILGAGSRLVWAAEAGMGKTAQLPVISGTVMWVDPAHQTLRIQDGMQQNDFVVTPKTQILSGSQQLKLEDIQPGATVTIQYSTDSGKQVSRSISVKEPSGENVQPPSLQ